MRAALFALVCVGAGTGLHQLAGGCPPGLTGPLLALPIVWLAGYGLARRERSTGFVTLALGLAQLGLHVELGWFCPKSAAMPGMPGYSAGHGTTAMIVAHAVAVAVCGWWLGRGERGFFELCRTTAFLAEGVADLLSGHLCAHRGELPALPPLRCGIHATAVRTSRPPRGPAPSPRVLRGPPVPACPR